MKKQTAEELADLFRNFDGDRKDEFIKLYPEIWDDCYDIMEESRYHRVMIKCVLAGFQARDEEVKQLRELLGECESRLLASIWFQQAAKKFLEHHADCTIITEEYEVDEEEECSCGLMDFAHGNETAKIIAAKLIQKIKGSE